MSNCYRFRSRPARWCGVSSMSHCFDRYTRTLACVYLPGGVDGDESCIWRPWSDLPRSPVPTARHGSDAHPSGDWRRTWCERFSTCSWCVSARISRCSTARERTSERTAMSTETTMGITHRRPFDRDATTSWRATRRRCSMRSVRHTRRQAEPLAARSHP